MLRSRQNYLAQEWSLDQVFMPRLVAWTLNPVVTLKSAYNNFHLFSQCVDEVGFCRFLKTYLEVEDFPANFCQRLFCYFQNADKSSLPKGGKSNWKCDRLLQHGMEQVPRGKAIVWVGLHHLENKQKGEC